MIKQRCESCNEPFTGICAKKKCKILYHTYGFYKDGLLLLDEGGKRKLDVNYKPKVFKKKKQIRNKMHRIPDKEIVQSALYLKEICGCNDFEVELATGRDKYFIKNLLIRLDS